MQKLIDIKNLNVRFNDKIIFSDFSLQIEKAECIGLFAPTGKGKTTLLNEIAQLYYDKLKISYVFQDNCLLLNKTVEKNINLVLDKKNDDVINKLLNDFDLVSKKYYPCKFLSGGEMQRVNLARAFAYDGDVFLLDEPFSSQDEKHKENIILLIKNELLKKEKTVILVSHNKKDLEKIGSTIISLE